MSDNRTRSETTLFQNEAKNKFPDPFFSANRQRRRQGLVLNCMRARSMLLIFRSLCFRDP